MQGIPVAPKSNVHIDRYVLHRVGSQEGYQKYFI